MFQHQHTDIKHKDVRNMISNFMPLRYQENIVLFKITYVLCCITSNVKVVHFVVYQINDVITISYEHLHLQ